MILPLLLLLSHIKFHHVPSRGQFQLVLSSIKIYFTITQILICVARGTKRKAHLSESHSDCDLLFGWGLNKKSLLCAKKKVNRDVGTRRTDGRTQIKDEEKSDWGMVHYNRVRPRQLMPAIDSIILKFHLIIIFCVWKSWIEWVFEWYGVLLYDF